MQNSKNCQNNKNNKNNKKTKIAMKIAYFGSFFCGFAPQKNEQIPSVVGALGAALQSVGIFSKIDRKSVV